MVQGTLYKVGRFSNNSKCRIQFLLKIKAHCCKVVIGDCAQLGLKVALCYLIHLTPYFWFRLIGTPVAYFHFQR